MHGNGSLVTQRQMIEGAHDVPQSVGGKQAGTYAQGAVAVHGVPDTPYAVNSTV